MAYENTFVHVKDGVRNDDVIKGIFRLIDIKTPEGRKRDEVLVVQPVMGGTHFAFHAYKQDYEIQYVHFNKEEKLKSILERFNVMSILTEGVIYKNIRSFIMAGSAGIGKTYNLMKRMDRALTDNEIDKYTVVKGRLSAPVLFKHLHEHAYEGEVLVLDDVDVFNDEKTLDILKGALDTNNYRRIDWGTQSRWLENEGVPQSFDFNGSVVFVSNKNFDRMMLMSSSLTPHINALVDRSIYLDLLVHDPDEIMLWVEHVVKNSNILYDKGITEEQVEELMEWLWRHYRHMRTLSIRSVEHIASFMHLGDGSHWKTVAKTTMLRPH